MSRISVALFVCLTPALAAADDFEGTHVGVRVRPPLLGYDSSGVQVIGVEGTLRDGWKVLEVDGAFNADLTELEATFGVHVGAAFPITDELRLFATGGYLFASEEADPFLSPGAHTQRHALGVDVALSVLAWHDLELRAGVGGYGVVHAAGTGNPAFVDDGAFMPRATASIGVEF